MQYSIGLFEGLVICYLWWGGGGVVAVSISRNLKRFSNWPPNSSQLFRNGLILYVLWKWCFTRSPWKLWIPWIQILPKFATYFFYSGCLLFLAVTFNFISCSLLLCTTFMTFIKMTPHVKLPYVKVTPQQKCHIIFTGNKWPAL